VTTITAKRAAPDAAYFVGSGKADEIAPVQDHRSKSSSSTTRCRLPSSATWKSA
jgi:hypothetical protein